MGNITDFLPEKLVLSVLLSDPALTEPLVSLLTGGFGPIDYQSEFLDFAFTSYYDKEMGTPLKKLFLAFKELVAPDTLAAAKIKTNRIEQDLALHGNRRVNLDPGLLCQSRFILASTKDSSHRIPLGQGIYGEITLMYEHGTFRALEWTYPDYRSAEYINTLNEIRAIYTLQIKSNIH
jgi:hypothetical protein